MKDELNEEDYGSYCRLEDGAVCLDIEEPENVKDTIYDRGTITVVYQAL